MKKYTQKTIKFYNKHLETCVKRGAILLKSKINKFAKLVPGDKIIDVACGPGHDTDYLTRKGFDCLGIDLSKKMIKYAKRNFKGKFKVMDFFDLKFREKTFDGIWCSSAIIHVSKRDLNEILREFLKILKEGGILGIIVPRTKKRLRKKGDMRIFTMFYRYELEKYLVKNGFEIIHAEVFSFTNMKWIFIIAKKFD